MKKSKVISTTALVLGGLMATTGTQTMVHADTVGQATTGTQTTKSAPTSAACAEEVQASQAVTSYATSQGVVASQAASQATSDTQSYASQLDTDPAKTADQERTDATNAKTTADAAADKTLTTDSNNAANVQSQATQQAHDNKTNADNQAATNQATTEANAKTAKDQADANAATTKTNADAQAAKTKADETSQAQSGKLDPKYTTAVTDAQNQLNADQAAVDQANASATTAYTAVPSNDSVHAPSGESIINNSKNLPTSIVDPKLSTADTNSTIAFTYYGVNLDKDDSAVINGDLSDSQQKELADYAVTLINSWRKSQGLNPVAWTQQAQDATVAIAKMRETNELGIKHTLSDTSSFKSLNDIALSQSLLNRQENLGYLGNFYDKITMNLMKVNILNSITAMIYQDAGSNWGHRDNFTNMNYMGFSIQVNTDSATSSILPYVLVFEGYVLAQADGSSDTSTQTVLTPTSAQTIEASRTSGGATAAQLQAVANDKVAVTNAQQALTDATNAVNQTIASQLTTINNKYTAQLQANTDAYQATLAQNETTYQNALAAAGQTYADALAANTGNEAAQIAQAQTDYDNAIAKATTAHDAAIAVAQKAFDTAYAAAHDETPAERDARHAELLTAFKVSEDTKLANLKTQQEVDFAAFKAAQDKLVADCLASHQTASGDDGQTPSKPATTTDGTSQTTTTDQGDQLDPQTTTTATTKQHNNIVALNVRKTAAKQPVSVVLPNVKPVSDSRVQPATTTKTTRLPQTAERRHGASASLFGLMLLSLSSLGYGLLRRKVR